MKKISWLFALVALVPAAAAAQAYDRYHELLDNSFKSPVWWVEAVGAGVIDQANRFPQEWNASAQPLAERTLARVGQSMVSSIMEAGGAAALRQHVGYENCACRGFLRRTGHVFSRTFVERKAGVGFALNVPFLAAKYGSAALANVWYPESYRARDVFTQGTFAVGTAIGLNFIAEFSPDLLHAVHLH